MSNMEQLEQGQTAKIVKMNHEEAVLIRLMEMGLLEGQQVTMIRKAPMGDPIEYKVGETHLSLRAEEARLVEVEV
jgi:ferrous iron transport protein A